ncbi:hypothetical protein P7K49_027288 [Saguinus oedipus]|uniref:Uncharacterized protein n=1 Tax=Saguinus oedipus TaxID=9490 RepID=A0ABQ9U9V4_SAGOE|nr:hypothetical protein P7K49_027288 [Saguinus oedipus]
MPSYSGSALAATSELHYPPSRGGRCDRDRTDPASSSSSEAPAQAAIAEMFAKIICLPPESLLLLVDSLESKESALEFVKIEGDKSSASLPWIQGASELVSTAKYGVFAGQSFSWQEEWAAAFPWKRAIFVDGTVDTKEKNVPRPDGTAQYECFRWRTLDTGSDGTDWTDQALQMTVIFWVGIGTGNPLPQKFPSLECPILVLVLLLNKMDYNEIDSEQDGKASLMKSSDIDQDLFTDSYCKVCSAQLISESQRVAHYEPLETLIGLSLLVKSVTLLSV